ncbi:tail fiber domain-containing protein [Spartinivicinus ruber]|uniref:tail fiber domain-containing protein n=1 Tax=Spartinivicinus ruber TaxID=2683272 RepID=UPI0013CF6670|nr:tail fiber domain-containing protein [Spartinivicinus ruber]
MKKLFTTIFFASLATASQAGSHEMCKHLSGNAYSECLSKPNFMRFSDSTLKKNQAKIDQALDKVSQLKGVKFEWKSPEETDIEHLPQGKDIGVIAQDVEKAFPELVHNVKVTDKNGAEVTLKQVNYAGLVGVLIEAVKELKQENKKLREDLGL